MRLQANGIALAIATLHVWPVVGTLINVYDSDRTTRADVFDIRRVAPSQVRLAFISMMAVSDIVSHL